MKTSLGKMNLLWTAHEHQKKTQRRNIKNPVEKDKWMKTPNLGDVCEEKPD